MPFLCSADKASAGRSVSAAARQVSGSAQDSGGSVQVQRSDMQLTVYSSLVTLTSSSCICTPMSLLWKRGGGGGREKKHKQRDNEINDKIRKGINAADVSASPQRWSGKVTLQVDTVNEDCGTGGSVLIKNPLTGRPERTRSRSGAELPPSPGGLAKEQPRQSHT